MLQDTPVGLGLGAAHEFLAGHGDLIRGGDFKTGGALVMDAEWVDRIHLNRHAENIEPGDQTGAEAPIRVEDGPVNARIVSRSRDAVGKLVGVEDGPPPGGSADEVHTGGPGARGVNAVEWLALAERQARRVPAVEAERGEDRARGDGVQN